MDTTYANPPQDGARILRQDAAKAAGIAIRTIKDEGRVAPNAAHADLGRLAVAP